MGAEGPAHPGGGAGSVVGVPWMGNESEKGGEVPASRGGFLPWLCEQGWGITMGETSGGSKSIVAMGPALAQSVSDQRRISS